MPTVREDVAFGPANLGLRGADRAVRVETALEAVEMAEFADRSPHHPSFGQRRRVAVATVLSMEPEILVLDEPSSNRDPASRRELAEILTRLPITLLMVTHTCLTPPSCAADRSSSTRGRSWSTGQRRTCSRTRRR